MDKGFRVLGIQKILRATINSSAASVALISAPGTNKRINVIAMSLASSAAATVTILSDDNELGRNDFKATDPAWVLPRNPDAWFQCNANEPLNLGNADEATLTGVVVYFIAGAD